MEKRSRLYLILGVMVALLLFGCALAPMIAQESGLKTVTIEGVEKDIEFLVPTYFEDPKDLMMDTVPLACEPSNPQTKWALMLGFSHTPEEPCFIWAVVLDEELSPLVLMEVEMSDCDPIKEWIYHDGKPVLGPKGVIEAFLSKYCEEKKTEAL